jgi:hypothetical protein
MSNDKNRPADRRYRSRGVGDQCSGAVNVHATGLHWAADQTDR